MIRAFHRWPGLLALALLTLLGLSGAALSVFPAAQRLAAPRTEANLDVATLAGRAKLAYPGVEQIRRAPSGQITVYWFDNGTPGAAVIDPATGQRAASADPNAVERWLTKLHRSLFLDDTGRIVTAVAAAALLVLAASGAALVARRNGGWRFWFARMRGPLAGRLHGQIARFAVAGLVLSSLTALWMTASAFDMLPDGDPTPNFPAVVSNQTGLDPAQMDILAQTPVSELRVFSYPYPDDPTDVFTLETDRGTGYIDQGTGALLAWQDISGWARVSETIYMLHTGQGAAALGLLLGLMALGIPALAVTGVVVWIAGRRGRPRIRGNVAAHKADTIVLVGSEGGSTWGFAATLFNALTAAGQSVHVGSMAAYNPQRYTNAQRLIVLAATYGDGAAPASAKSFLDRFETSDPVPSASLAVLGFGDRGFPEFCAFARAVTDTAGAKGWPTLVPFDTVDRQSPQDFARWGLALGAALGIDLSLSHQPVLPVVRQLTLVSRRDYGAEVQAPTAILRFALPRLSLWQRLTGVGFARFQAGDLLGILPTGGKVPRLYSLASSRGDGFIEIVVKKHPGGLCSAQLTSLAPGDTVSGFLRRNPAFRAGRDQTPLILIGAGTGIGPLAGMIRGNARQRPIHLFFGMRHPDSDFLYAEEIHAWQDQGSLTELKTAVSRGGMRTSYVQDALRADATRIAGLIRDGARIMVCGGRGMANGVTSAFEDILAPTGISPASLKAEGRYLEDVY